MSLKGVKVTIQDGDKWIRVLMNETIIIEGPQITSKDLKELLADLGCGVRLQHGFFTDEKDSEGDDAFECQHEEK